MSTTTRTPAEFWPMTDRDAVPEPLQANLEVERDDGGPGRVVIHTYVNGEGSLTSYYLDREAAIEMARDILGAVALSD